MFVMVNGLGWQSEESENLYVYIPLRRYNFKLKHKLLDQLGAFSHLVLEAFMQLPDQSISCWVEKVTGLTQQQLQPIFNRLVGLGIVSNGQLSQKGKHLAEWRRLLHGRSCSIWLDGQHHIPSFCCVGDTPKSVVQLGKDTGFVIQPWNKNGGNQRDWPYQSYIEDCERQKRRISTYAELYLGAAFETFQDCFQRLGFNIREWDLEIEYKSSFEHTALKVRLEKESLQLGGSYDYVVSSPILCLETNYSLPDGAPRDLKKLLPENQRYAVSFSDLIKIKGDEETSETLVREWVWPKIETSTYCQAVNSLFQHLSELESPAHYSIFNRSHSLEYFWVDFGFDQDTLTRSCLATEGVHPIVSKGLK